MLRRASIFSVIAGSSGVLGLSGVFDGAAIVVQSIFVIAAGMCGLSLLFCLFEPCEAIDEPVAVSYPEINYPEVSHSEPLPVPALVHQPA